MSTINQQQDYAAALFPGAEEEASKAQNDIKISRKKEIKTSIEPLVKNSTRHELKTTRTQGIKKSRSKEVKTPGKEEPKSSRTIHVKNSGSVEKKSAKKESPMLSTSEIDHKNQEVKTPITRQAKKSISKEVKTSRTKEPKKSRKKEAKKSKVIIDEEGKIRRPANIMMMDDVKIALDVLAARRRVWSWKLIDQALREYLEKENAL